jgi:hypothetical protein
MARAHKKRHMWPLEAQKRGLFNHEPNEQSRLRKEYERSDNPRSGYLLLKRAARDAAAWGRKLAAARATGNVVR